MSDKPATPPSEGTSEVPLPDRLNEFWTIGTAHHRMYPLSMFEEAAEKLNDYAAREAALLDIMRLEEQTKHVHNGEPCAACLGKAIRAILKPPAERK